MQIDSSLKRFYQDQEPEEILILFDLRDHEAVARFHRERAAWQGDSDIEALGPDHFVLIIRPGGAARKVTGRHELNCASCEPEEIPERIAGSFDEYPGPDEFDEVPDF